jgi:hypothetical protein
MITASFIAGGNRRTRRKQLTPPVSCWVGVFKGVVSDIDVSVVGEWIFAVGYETICG